MEPYAVRSGAVEERMLSQQSDVVTEIWSESV